MITKEMQRELAYKARAANRRLERASEGQRSALEHYIKGYSGTRESSRGTMFQQGAAKTETEYRQRMRELEKFMGGETSTRRGWKELKSSNVEKAAGTLGEMGYDISEDELVALLEEIPDGADSATYYKALENVQAAKNKKGGTLTRKEIIKAISERRSDYEATLGALKSRRK